MYMEVLELGVIPVEAGELPEAPWDPSHLNEK